MKYVAEIEYNGVPIDTDLLNELQENWEKIKFKLIKILTNLESTKEPVLRLITLRDYFKSIIGCGRELIQVCQKPIRKLSRK